MVAVFSLGWTPSRRRPMRSRSNTSSTMPWASFRMPSGVTAVSYTHLSKFLEERGPGIHHIKESILDNDALDAAVAEYSSRGPKVNYQGKYMEDHYFYLDTFDALGAYYEMGNNAKVSAKPEFVGWYPEEP